MNGLNLEQMNSIHSQIKLLQEENRQLKHDMAMQKMNKIDSNAVEAANKNVLVELVNIIYI